MDRRNLRIFYRNNDRGFGILIMNKNRNDCCILENGIISNLDEDDTNKIKSDYTKIIDCFCCLGIFESVNEINNHLVVVTSADWITKLNEADIFKIKNVQFIEIMNDNEKKSIDNYEINGLQKLLESGYFYFGKGIKGRSIDISVNIENSKNGKEIDYEFIWNKYLLKEFKKYEINNEWYTGIICGSVLANTIYSNIGNIKICIISRVNCQRIGTRFASRGIDDFGYVANFVETEQCFIGSDGSQLSSYVQVRGSVPLFWEQPGIQVGSHKIKFSRSVELSSLAYEKHFDHLKSLYNNRIEIVNLLGSSEGERKLSMGYVECHKHSKFNDIKMINYDLHKEGGIRSTNIEKLKSKLREFVEETHFCWINNGEMVQRQFGVVRTNCVDCLDRTNAVQTLIGLEFVLEKQLKAIIPNSKSKLTSVMENFRTMWKTNGDNISLIYAGSGALGSGNKLVDAQKSVKRTYMATFNDSQKNSMIMTLLRPNTLCDEDFQRAKEILPLSILDMDKVFLKNMLNMSLELTNIKELQIFVGTWNVNGGKNFQSIAHKHQSVTDWLLDLPLHSLEHNPECVDSSINTDILSDIFAIGFEEIVDLTASNIVSTKSGNQLQWARYLLLNISSKTDYMLLSTIQLVGICLYVFVKTTLAPFITEVSTASVKTGFKGTAGNKGGVGISFQLYNSSFCFVCSHFAAGQSNYKERNDDYRDIYRGMKFANGSSINCHDFIYWCGDFNYRIDKPISEVKQLIIDKNYAELKESDQLYNQRKLGKVFEKFKEGSTLFAPTYKYDIFCDDYDTSEKCRVPAWTDRVLWKVNVPNSKSDDLCKLLLYNRSELKTSDHRPVAALFSVKAFQVNKKLRYDRLIKEMLAAGPRNAIVRVQVEEFVNAIDIPDELLQFIITSFSEIGRIILVRFSGSDLLLNYSESRNVIDAISKFDQTYLEENKYFVHVNPFDKEWKQSIYTLLEKESIELVKEYPPLLTELIKNVNQRSSVLREDYLYNEDDEDIKEGSGSISRARSCSPRRKEAPTTLKPDTMGDPVSSCNNLLEKVFIDNNLPKRPPPMRPPPISHSELTMSNNNTQVIEPSEDLLVFEAPTVTLRRPPITQRGLYDEGQESEPCRPIFTLKESDVKIPLPMPLVPMQMTSNRPLPKTPEVLTKNEEELSMRPLPPVPTTIIPAPPPRK